MTGPYRVAGWQVLGPSAVAFVASDEEALVLCARLNSAYSAGVAEGRRQAKSPCPQCKGKTMCDCHLCWGRGYVLRDPSRASTDSEQTFMDEVDEVRRENSRRGGGS